MCRRGSCTGQMRRQGRKAQSIGAAVAFSTLDLEPLIFITNEDDYITRSGTDISAIANQGTASGSFEQGTGAAQPQYVANHFAAGKHGIYFDGARYMVSSAAWNPASTGVTVGWVGYTTGAAGFKFVAASTQVYEEISNGGIAYDYHHTGGGSSLRLGATDLGSLHSVISTHDVTLSTDETQVFVDAVSEDGGDGGFNGDNVAAFGSSSWWLGTYSGLAFNFEGYLAALVVVPRVLDAGEIAQLHTALLARAT